MLLLTGWTWFIGSHTAVALLEAWVEVVLFDNLSNSKSTVVDAIERITGKRPYFVHGDVTNRHDLQTVFQDFTIDGVIHFAAKKAVWESCEDPWLYYHENIVWLITLTQVMEQCACKKIVFSSSCTVYDPIASKAPYDESAPIGNAFSPYWTTKCMSEMLLRDLTLHKHWQVIPLRYFNPIGAHPSGLIFEDAAQPPTNLLPVIMQTLTWQRDELSVFGDTYATNDGTCLRDYIHVMDLANAHRAAWKYLQNSNEVIFEPFNIGTGTPTSVIELIQTVESVTWQSVPYRFVAPRPWDVPIAYALPTKAQNILQRSAQLPIQDAVRDSWHALWHK